VIGVQAIQRLAHHGGGLPGLFAADRRLQPCNGRSHVIESPLL